MTTTHSAADDLVYDLVSIQYHALKGAQLCEQFRRDAQDHADVAAFIERVQQEYAARAAECHELLHGLTHDHGIAGDDGAAGADGVGRTDSARVGEGAAPLEGAPLGAGATSGEALTGTVEGGGVRTGISAAGEGEGTGSAEGATGDSADGLAGLNAEGPAATAQRSGWGATGLPD